jgi:hypothetical protein
MCPPWINYEFFFIIRMTKIFLFSKVQKMPYGRMYRRAPRVNRSSFTRGVAASARKGGKAAAVAKARAVNKPIARIQRKRMAPISKVAKNTQSVVVLARQVRALQRARIGEIQRHVMEASSFFIIPKTTPAIFSMINFGNSVQITEYRHSASPPYVTNTLLATLAPATGSQMNLTPAQTAQAAVLDQYKFYKTSTDDSVPVDASYVPISSTMLIQLTTTFSSSSALENDRWVLIMFVKQKPSAIKVTSNIHHYNLPDAAAGLVDLASENPFERMPFPRSHYKVLVKKWVKLSRDHKDADHRVDKTFTMRFSYPHQYVNNDESAVTNPANPTGSILYDNFNQRIPIAQNVFCIMQSSIANIECRMRKTDVWRDPHGND